MQAERYTPKRRVKFSLLRFYIAILILSLLVNAYAVRGIKMDDRSITIVWSSAFRIPILGSYFAFTTGHPQIGDLVLVDMQKVSQTRSTIGYTTLELLKKGLSYLTLGLVFDRRHIAVLEVQALPHDNYAYVPLQESDEYFFSETQTVTIPKEHYMLISTREGDLNDSKFFGPIASQAILGKVVTRLEY